MTLGRPKMAAGMGPGWQDGPFSRRLPAGKFSQMVGFLTKSRKKCRKRSGFGNYDNFPSSEPKPVDRFGLFDGSVIRGVNTAQMVNSDFGEFMI